MTGRQQEESSGAGPTADEPATTTTPTTEMGKFDFKTFSENEV